MVLSVAVFLLFSVSSLGLLDQINESYIDSVSELPISSGSPDMVWQQQGHIRAWIDVVGFRNMAYINGNYYVPENPADAAIVKNDVQVQLSSNVKGLERYVCYWCQLDSMTKSISSRVDGKNVVATLTVTIKWHETLENSGGEQRIDYVEIAEFQDSELSPLRYDVTKEYVEINEVNYNHSLYAEKLIYVNTSNLITRYNVSIDNGSVLHRLQIGEIQCTRKKIPYANYTIFDTWKQSGSSISYLDKAAVIQNINGSYSLTAYSPFGQVNNTNTTVTNITWSPEKAVAHFIFLIIFILSVAFWGVNKMRKL